MVSALLAVGEAVVDSDGVDFVEPSVDGLGDEYKSEYQPPPLRMK